MGMCNVLFYCSLCIFVPFDRDQQTSARERRQTKYHMGCSTSCTLVLELALVENHTPDRAGSCC